MSNLFQDSMWEATRLTNEGRLAEATAAIQRALGGISTPEAPENIGGTEGSVETTSRVLEGADRPPENANFGQVGDVLRPSRHYRGVPRLANGSTNSLPNGLPDLPDSLPGLPNGLPGPTKGVPGPAVVPAGGQFVERSHTGPAGGR